MPKDRNPLGTISQIGTLLLLCYLVFRLNMFDVVLSELNLFFTGRAFEIPTGFTSLGTMLSIILTVLVLDLAATIAAMVIPVSLYGKPGGHSLCDFLDNLIPGYHFVSFFTLVVLEELFARYLFLGFLPKIPALSGQTAFYALMLIGNTIWAGIHLANFKEEKDKKLLFTLPQFVGGIFLSYVYLKFGLFGSVLAHFAGNAIILSSHKVQRVTIIDGLHMLYGALCAWVSYLLMTKPLSDMSVWFSSTPVFELEGWTFWDYIIATVFISSIMGLVFDLLLYDRGTLESDEKEYSWGVVVIAYLLNYPILFGLMLGTYGLLGWFGVDVFYRIVLVALIFALFSRQDSFGAVSRQFWTGLPYVYIMSCLLIGLGFVQTVAWALTMSVIAMPKSLLRKHDN